MLRRRYGTSLSREVVIEEDINPSAYIANIADCMLVLLLGVIVALIAYYNVDLTEAAPEDEIVGVEVNLDQNKDGLIDDNFQEQRGSVYYDKDTGEYYYVSDARR